MLPANHNPENGPRDLSSDESRHAFHDLLLIRSKECLGSRKRGAAARLASRKLWISLGFRLGRFALEGGLFVGGLALGAGLILVRRGEAYRGRPGLFIAAGLGFVALTLLARALAGTRTNGLRQAARG